jgi:hypothetical protein
MSYQPYPRVGNEVVPPRPPAPPSIRNAVRLMYVGAGLSGLAVIFILAISGRIERAIGKAVRSVKSAKPLTAAQLHAGEVTFVAIIIITLLIAVGLWFWMARANSSGKKWARVCSSVIFGLNTILLVYVARAAGAAAFVGVSWLIGLATLFFLWRKDSSDYFNAASGY